MKLSGIEEQDSILYWAENCEWPHNFADMSQDRSDGSHKRRRSETPSYSRGVREGINPPAHSPAYETVLEGHGIMFNDLDTREELGAESKELCKTMYQGQLEQQQKEMARLRQEHKEQSERQQALFEEQIALISQMANNKIIPEA